MTEKPYEPQEQLKAAYALNMCMVSVSQIVDYNDEYILEQESEAMLNNLNLEQIPKDEALLNILVKLLNVITFFRIEKIKKEQIEKKYQRRIKNAIWSAVPHIGIIDAGNPIKIGFSLATQVGIGYMNYRREKANALAEKEDAAIELRITAMEQFNALRRELFTTAWRLADEYRFPDRYRLTERQITQYNNILMDADELRKYERLMSIKDKFEAYIPFWYFIGHSAKYISEDINNGLDATERTYFKEKAKEHFAKFDDLNSFNILREDELTASFALEYVDLLLLDEQPDRDKISRLINTAVEKAGNANDILELCAISYLKIGDTEEAGKLLRVLVNEGYNTATNAKLLSRIYVSEFLRGNNLVVTTQYKILSSRVNSAWLFPMPDKKVENLLVQDQELQEKYFLDQQINLKDEYEDVIKQFMEKYIIRFNRIIPVPVNDAPDEYFLNDELALKRRRQDVYDALESDSGNEYRKSIKESGFRFRYVELLNEMLKALDGLRLFRDDSFKEQMVGLISENLKKASGELKEIQERLNQDDAFTIMDYEKIQKSFSFQKLTEGFFAQLNKSFGEKIREVKSLDLLDDIELDIVQFCRDNGIQERIQRQNDEAERSETKGEDEYISRDILGRDEFDESFARIIFEKMLSTVKGFTGSIVSEKSKVELLVRGDQKFELYFKNVKLKGDPFKSMTLAVLDDLTSSDSDLLVTRDGVVLVKHNKVEDLRGFDKIEYQGKSISLGGSGEYNNRGVDLGQLYYLLEKLGRIRNNAGIL